MEKPGPTGNFPEGKLNKDDEGELKIAIAADHRNNVVLIRFGGPVAWFAMGPEQALQFANQIKGKGKELMKKGRKPK